LNFCIFLSLRRVVDANSRLDYCVIDRICGSSRSLDDRLLYFFKSLRISYSTARLFLLMVMVALRRLDALQLVR
jgi:hypothetical protein